MLSPDIIEELQRRVRDVALAVDHRHARDHRVAPPADVDALASVERTLGFGLPEELREVYLKIANGGFGPGYGLLGVASGATDDRGNTADTLYKVFAQDSPDDPEWNWPSHVVPFCCWGCAVYSCITADGQVIGFDEGEWVGEPLPLDAWLRAWLEGSLQQPTDHLT